MSAKQILAKSVPWIIAAALGAIGVHATAVLAHEGHDHGSEDPHPTAPAPMTPGAMMEGGHGDHEHGDHEHGSIEVSAAQPVPTVSLTVHPDSRSGWNLEITTTHFRFAPENINQATTSTAEGHAHLYVNGEKLTRLYGSWYYLASLPPGRHEVTVSLNANGHEALMHNNQPIASTVVIDVPEASP